MKTDRKGERLERRIGSWVGKKEISFESLPKSSSAIQPGHQSPYYVGDDHGDRQRTVARYIEATSLLENAVNITRKEGEFLSFDVPLLSNEPEDFDDAQFREQINQALYSQKYAVKDQTVWLKWTNGLERIFQVSSPFLKNVLIIARDAQQVLPLTP
jgi:exoribonuclease II